MNLRVTLIVTAINNAKKSSNSISKYNNEKSKNNKMVRIFPNLMETTFWNLMETTFWALANCLNLL